MLRNAAEFNKYLNDERHVIGRRDRLPTIASSKIPSRNTVQLGDNLSVIYDETPSNAVGRTSAWVYYLNTANGSIIFLNIRLQPYLVLTSLGETTVAEKRDTDDKNPLAQALQPSHYASTIGRIAVPASKEVSLDEARSLLPIVHDDTVVGASSSDNLALVRVVSNFRWLWAHHQSWAVEFSRLSDNAPVEQTTLIAPIQPLSARKLQNIINNHRLRLLKYLSSGLMHHNDMADMPNAEMMSYVNNKSDEAAFHVVQNHDMPPPSFGDMMAGDERRHDGVINPRLVSSQQRQLASTKRRAVQRMERSESSNTDGRWWWTRWRAKIPTLFGSNTKAEQYSAMTTQPHERALLWDISSVQRLSSDGNAIHTGYVFIPRNDTIGVSSTATAVAGDNVAWWLQNPVNAIWYWWRGGKTMVLGPMATAEHEDYVNAIALSKQGGGTVKALLDSDRPPALPDDANKKEAETSLGRWLAMKAIKFTAYLALSTVAAYALYWWTARYFGYNSDAFVYGVETPETIKTTATLLSNAAAEGKLDLAYLEAGRDQLKTMLKWSPSLEYYHNSIYQNARQTIDGLDKMARQQSYFELVGQKSSWLTTGTDPRIDGWIKAIKSPYNISADAAFREVGYLNDTSGEANRLFIDGWRWAKTGIELGDASRLTSPPPPSPYYALTRGTQWITAGLQKGVEAAKRLANVPLVDLVPKATGGAGNITDWQKATAWDVITHPITAVGVPLAVGVGALWQRIAGDSGSSSSSMRSASSSDYRHRRSSTVVRRRLLLGRLRTRREALFSDDESE